jgi:hypothetical protein
MEPAKYLIFSGFLPYRSNYKLRAIPEFFSLTLDKFIKPKPKTHSKINALVKT